MSHTRTVAPAQGILTLDEAKASARVDGADDDALISGMIDEATEYLDGYSGVLGRALITQTWAESHRDFPNGRRLDIGLAPVQSISSITYYDVDGVSQTLSASDYRPQADGYGAYAELVDTATWPSVADRADAVTVTYVAGYGANAGDVPAPIRTAARLLVGHFYDNRESIIIGTIASMLPMGVAEVLAPYRRSGV